MTEARAHMQVFGKLDIQHPCDILPTGDFERKGLMLRHLKVVSTSVDFVFDDSIFALH